MQPKKIIWPGSKQKILEPVWDTITVRELKEQADTERLIRNPTSSEP